VKVYWRNVWIRSRLGTALFQGEVVGRIDQLEGVDESGTMCLLCMLADYTDHTQGYWCTTEEVS